MHESATQTAAAADGASEPTTLRERANSGLHAHALARASALEPRREAMVVDLGCGTGAFLVQLRQRGYRHLVGLDIAPPPRLEGVTLATLDLDACHTGLPEGCAHLVTAIEVFEHVENLGGLLAELKRILAPEGSVFVTTPNVHSLEARLRFLLLGQLKQFDALGDPTHISPIFRFPFERLVARHGLRVSECWGFPEDGSSPTSRPVLRTLARLAGWCGLRGQPGGDQLCLVLRHAAGDPAAPAAPTGADAKRLHVTAHYGRG